MKFLLFLEVGLYYWGLLEVLELVLLYPTDVGKLCFYFRCLRYFLISFPCVMPLVNVHICQEKNVHCFGWNVR